MKKLKLTLIFLFLLTTSINAQHSYLEYYQLISVARQLQSDGALDEALEKYETAFSQVDFVHEMYLEEGIKLARKLGNHQAVAAYKAQLKKQKANINQPLVQEINKLVQDDQSVRSKKYIKARDLYYGCERAGDCDQTDPKYLKSKHLMEEWWRIDSVNIGKFKEIIRTHGFPGEALIGQTGARKTTVLLLHYDRDTMNHIMGNTLYEALDQGKMLPRDYANIIDRHRLLAGKEQLYLAIPTSHLTPLNEAQKILIDERRVAIGLGRLEERKVIRRGNSVIVKH